MTNNFRPHKTAILMGVLAFLVLFWAYSNSFHNVFQFDDLNVIVSNIYVRDLHNVPKFFTDAKTYSSNVINATYRPLVTLSLAIDYKLGNGLDPRQFHITQLALLMILGVMLFFFFRRLMAAPWLAFVAALFCCVHTANTETMNIISVRSELLSTIGLVGSFLMYLGLPRSRRFFLYLIPMVVGAFAKPPAVMFAPLLFVYVFLFEEVSPSFRERAFQSFKRALPALVVGFVVFVFVNGMNAPESTYGGGGRLDYLMTQGFVCLHYVRLFFFPIGLTADADWELLPHWYDTRFFAGILFLALFLYLIRKTSKQSELKPVTFGLIWFLITLLPTSSIFPLAEVVNEHRLFVPFIGLSLAATGAVAVYAMKWGRGAVLAAWVLASLIVVAHAVGTFTRNTVWKSEDSLWFDVIQKSPMNARALMNYGVIQLDAGRLNEARDYFERALPYAPYYGILEGNLGVVYSALGDPGKGELHFQRALRLSPKLVAIRRLYARQLQKQGRLDDAIAQLLQSIALSPSDAEARALLMQLYAQKGDKENLRKQVEETLAISPNDPVANGYAKDLQNQ